MELEQMTLFDLLIEFGHEWKKIPDNARVMSCGGPGVTTVLDTGIKKKENIEFAVHGFVDNQLCWIGCVNGSNGEAIAIMYADDFEEDERPKVIKCPCDTCQTAIDRCGCQMHLCSEYQKWKGGGS